MKKTSQSSFADRRPGDLFRAMAKLFLLEHPKQSRESLARKLRRRLDELGVSYHPRTLKRQLEGTVGTVPPVVEKVMRELVERDDTGDLERRLDAAGLRVDKEALRPPFVAVGRLVAPTRLWLYLNPGLTKRYLAHQLSRNLSTKGMGVSSDRLQSNLVGKGTYVRREVLRELLLALSDSGYSSEAAVQREYETRRLHIERALAGRGLTDAARVKKLAEVWRVLRTGESKRALAKRLRQRLSAKGIDLSLDHLQDQLHGRKELVQARVGAELEAAVRADLPAGADLEDWLERAEERSANATDLHWVKAQPIAEAASRWVADNPNVSRRQLAIRVAAAVRQMGYETSHNTVAPILAGARSKTRGFLYRAVMETVGLDGTIPDHAVLRPKHANFAQRRKPQLRRSAG